MRNFNRRELMAASAALGTTAAFPGLARAENYELTVVSASPVQFIWNKVIHEHFVPEATGIIEGAGDSVTWKELYGTMVKRGGEVQAVRDGAADVAFPTMTAYVSEFPIQNLSYVIPYATDDMAAVSGAMHELSQSDPGIIDSFDRYDNTYIANYVTPSYQLWTKFPVNNVSDLNGVKLGCSGLTANWIKGTGAVPVEQHLPGFYNDIKNGVYDGALTWLWIGDALKLVEVAPYVTLVTFGAVCPSVISVSTKLLDSSPQLRDAFMAGGKVYMEQVISQQAKLETAAVDNISAAGGTIRNVDFDERVEWAGALDEVVAEWVEAVEAIGMPARNATKRYIELLERKGVTMARQWKV